MSHLATILSTARGFISPIHRCSTLRAAPPGQAVSDPKADEDLINVRDKLGDTAGSLGRDQRSIAQRQAPEGGPPVMFVGL